MAFWASVQPLLVFSYLIVIFILGSISYDINTNPMANNKYAKPLFPQDITPLTTA